MPATPTPLQHEVLTILAEGAQTVRALHTRLSAPPTVRSVERLLARLHQHGWIAPAPPPYHGPQRWELQAAGATVIDAPLPAATPPPAGHRSHPPTPAQYAILTLLRDCGGLTI